MLCKQAAVDKATCSKLISATLELTQASHDTVGPLAEPALPVLGPTGKLGVGSVVLQRPLHCHSRPICGLLRKVGCLPSLLGGIEGRRANRHHSAFGGTRSYQCLVHSFH